MSSENLFLSRLEKFKSEEKHQVHTFDLISNLRLLTAVAGLTAGGVLGYFKNWVLAGYAVLPFLLIFFVLVGKHQKIDRALHITRTRAKINRRYLDRINGQWVMFADKGEEFMDIHHPYTNDLDIFGPKSVFQWISIATTCAGRFQLSQLLANPPKDLDLIHKRQQAVKELGNKLEFCQELECRGLLTDDAVKNPQELIGHGEELLFPGQAIGIIRTLPIFFVMAWGAYYLDLISIGIPVVLLLLQTVIALLSSTKISEPLHQVYHFKQSLLSYKKMLELIESEPFKDGYLKSLQAKLFFNRQSASQAMHRLESISNAIDLRRSIFYLALNIGLLWDIQVYIRLANWKASYGTMVRVWLDIIGTLESLSSLAVVSHVHPDWAFPQLDNNGQKITARELGHPLLHQDRCVRNDIQINNFSCIVTGSNMSGKSTWLRAIGTNLVLAYAGAPVCSRYFYCSLVDIYTSMEIRDDLLDGISTFYAELKRVKMILEHSLQDRPMLYLIDEIFKGTNSLDRITGAQVVLKTLSQKGAIGLISTHDLELCALEKEPWANFVNYHFEERYNDGRIEFDYKLRPGRCQTSNARYLMKMVGIDISKGQHELDPNI